MTSQSWSQAAQSREDHGASPREVAAGRFSDLPRVSLADQEPDRASVVEDVGQVGRGLDAALATLSTVDEAHPSVAVDPAPSRHVHWSVAGNSATAWC